MTYPLIVVAAALVANGRVLVQQRPAGRAHAGLWEFPGGKLEPGEAARAALRRELAEELAITVDEDALTPLGFATDEGGARSLVMLLYVCRSWSGAPQLLDAAALRWVDAESLRALAMPPVDLDLLDAVSAALAA
jgi:8-oxo-dGTP diphosphatase